MYDEGSVLIWLSLSLNVETLLRRRRSIAYAKKLEAARVPVALNVFKGIPHPGLSMAAVLPEGRRFQEEMIAAARKALWG